MESTTTLRRKDRLKDWTFGRVHQKNLVYNTCWEDPRCDRHLMDFQSDSEVVMITSAGCNALDYLLDDPKRINCIDMNFRQNSLLQLKLAFFKNSKFSNLFGFFGDGMHPEANDIYQDELRAVLPEFAQKYWDKRISFFNGKGPRKSFYYYGTSGIFAWMASRYLKAHRGMRKKIDRLFEARNLEEQSAIYNQIEPRLMNRLIQWLVNRHLVMSLVGVPRSQQELFVESYEKGALGYIQECLRKVFTKLPIQDNYFWRLYLKGAYTPSCCPEYLKEENFEKLRANANRIVTHTTTISNFLKENPGPYSHFILLDHQDWLAANDVPALEEEWRLILKNSRPGTKILLRSAAQEVNFFPDFVLEAVDFEEEKTPSSHQEDRVGTYASVYLAIVK